MTFEAIYSTAVDVVNKLATGGEVLGPDKTVCVICSGTGRIYYGISRMDMSDGSPTAVHAEIDAIRNMQGLGENTVSQLILIDTVNLTAMLPCNGCVGFILSQNPENASGVIAMPDRMIPFAEVGRYTGGGIPSPAPAPPQSSAPAKSISAKSDLLKNRVNSIMQGVSDDDDDDEDGILEELEKEKPKKKKLFGLFG